MAGFSQRFRMQVLLEPSLLVGLVGRDLTGLAVRRDGQDLRPMTGGRTSLVVRLSTPARSPSSAVEAFSANEGNDAREVFRGLVVIPDAPALSHRNGATWESPHAVEVTFATSFRYAGGTLCVDIEGTPVAGFRSPWWRIDYDLTTHDGRVAPFGQPCDPRTRAFASATTLVPAGSVRLFASGPTTSVGVLLLGATRLPAPLPLGFLGAPSCTLDIAPMVALGTDYSALPHQGYGTATLGLQLPGTREVAGALLVAQWAAFPAAQNPASLSTTNAVELGIAASPLPPRSVMVRTGPADGASPLPAYGRVLPHLAPVFCLRSQ
jgi:hypothetical protein